MIWKKMVARLNSRSRKARESEDEKFIKLKSRICTVY